MNQISLAALILTMMFVAAFATPSIALAQNMSGGIPEQSKLPAGNMTGNRGYLPDSYLAKWLDNHSEVKESNTFFLVLAAMQIIKLMFFVASIQK